jgi:hypothetical protein
VHFVADETGSPVDEVQTPSETILEVNLMTLCDGDSIGYDDHRASWPVTMSPHEGGVASFTADRNAGMLVEKACTMEAPAGRRRARCFGHENKIRRGEAAT